MTLEGFSTHFGISVIVRRHFAYRKPVSDDVLGYPTRGALTYTRSMERDQMGLTFDGQRKAFEQGEQLASMGIVPNLIIAGDAQRNIDGANATVEAIAAALEEDDYPPVQVSPAVTYPHYADFGVTREALTRYGDLAVHRNLAGLIDRELWTEPAAVFEVRIIAAVLADYGVRRVLFDLNFEQVTLLYFLHVQGIRREDIPFDEEAWQPKLGGGIVYPADRSRQAREFLPDLTVVL